MEQTVAMFCAFRRHRESNSGGQNITGHISCGIHNLQCRILDKISCHLDNFSFYQLESFILNGF